MWFDNRKCIRYPQGVAKSPDDRCGEFKSQVLGRVIVEEKKTFTCACGKEFRSEQGLKTHTGRMGGRHAAI